MMGVGGEDQPRKVTKQGSSWGSSKYSQGVGQGPLRGGVQQASWGRWPERVGVASSGKNCGSPTR